MQISHIILIVYLLPQLSMDCCHPDPGREKIVFFIWLFAVKFAQITFYDFNGVWSEIQSPDLISFTPDNYIRFTGFEVDLIIFEEAYLTDSGGC